MNFLGQTCFSFLLCFLESYDFLALWLALPGKETRKYVCRLTGRNAIMWEIHPVFNTRKKNAFGICKCVSFWKQWSILVKSNIWVVETSGRLFPIEISHSLDSKARPGAWGAGNPSIALWWQEGMIAVFLWNPSAWDCFRHQNRSPWSLLLPKLLRTCLCP